MFSRFSIPAILILCTSCGGPDRNQPAAGAATKPAVYVVNYPLQYFAERIAGDAVDVVFPAPNDVDPAYWKPSDKQIRTFQSADVIVLNGADYAKWTSRVSLPRSKVVNTSKAFADDLLVVEDLVVHRHGPDGEHAHSGTAMHTWLDPQQAIEQAAAIAAELAKRLADQAAEFQKNLDELKQDLTELDRSLTASITDIADTNMLASHPVYHYLARRCDWELTSFHWEPDEMPAEDEWEKLKSLMGERPGRWLMLWEDTPVAEIADRLKSLEVEVVVFRPCGNAPNEGDFLTEMRANIARLERSIAKQESVEH